MFTLNRRPWLVTIDGDTDAGSAPSDEVDTDADAGGHQQEPRPQQQKATETVDYWKRRARENEQRAKTNADAAKRLQEIEDRDKSEQQRAADALAQAQKAAAEATADAIRYRAAAKHGVTGDDVELIGAGDEESVLARAERIGQLLAAEKRLAEIDDAHKQRIPNSEVPKPQLRSGAAPTTVDVRPSGIDAMSDLLAARGWVAQGNTNK